MHAKPFEWAKTMMPAWDKRSWYSIRSAWIHSIDHFCKRNCRLNLQNTNVTSNVWEWSTTQKVDCKITNPPTQPHLMPLPSMPPPSSCPLRAILGSSIVYSSVHAPALIFVVNGLTMKCFEWLSLGCHTRQPKILWLNTLRMSYSHLGYKVMGKF